jgi:hypothetical protein
VGNGAGAFGAALPRGAAVASAAACLVLLLPPLAAAVPADATPGASEAAAVTVTLLDGDVLTGQLVSLRPDAVTVRSGDQPQEIPTSEVLTVAPARRESPSAAPPKVWLQLTDGSRVQGTEFRESAGAAVVELTSGLSVDLPTRSIHWVRLNPPSDSVDSQWNQIVARDATIDMVVVRRPGGNLDYVEGALQSVTDQSVRFSFDGEAVDVPRARLEGLIYYVAPSEDVPSVVCRVVDVDGNSWNAAAVSLSAEELRVETVAAVDLSVPLGRLEKLDFGTGNVVYLSDLEPLKVQWTPLLASTTVSDGLEQLFLPRRDQSFQGETLRLRLPDEGNRVREFHKGLATYSRTELVYRLPAGFRRLKGWAGIDEAVSEGGGAQLTIWADGQLLFHQMISRPAEPVAMDVNIEGKERLTILVDFADDQALAGQLDLCNIRITK